MRKTLQAMKEPIAQLKAGTITIGDCEDRLNKIITKAAFDIPELNDQARFIRVMKRRGWRMLLNATGKDDMQKEVDA